MTLKAMLLRDFGRDFPISGAFGQSLDAPIIVHRQTPNDYTSVEYGVLECLGKGRRVTWKLLRQSLLTHDGRSIDQLKIETKQVEETQQFLSHRNGGCQFGWRHQPVPHALLHSRR